MLRSGTDRECLIVSEPVFLLKGHVGQFMRNDGRFPTESKDMVPAGFAVWQGSAGSQASYKIYR